MRYRQICIACRCCCSVGGCWLFLCCRCCCSCCCFSVVASILDHSGPLYRLPPTFLLLGLNMFKRGFPPVQRVFYVVRNGYPHVSRRKRGAMSIACVTFILRVESSVQSRSSCDRLLIQFVCLNSLSAFA